MPVRHDLDMSAVSVSGNRLMLSTWLKVVPLFSKCANTDAEYSFILGSSNQDEHVKAIGWEEATTWKRCPITDHFHYMSTTHRMRNTGVRGFD